MGIGLAKKTNFGRSRFKGIRVSWNSLSVRLAAGITVVCVAVGVVVYLLVPAPATARVTKHSPPIESDGAIEPITALTGLNPGKVDLGRRLFADTRLSQDNRVSCSSCHNLSTGGADRRAKSSGVNGTAGEMNAPTVLNSGFNFRQGWDGRADTLENQIDGSVHSKNEMGSTWPEVVRKLKGSRDYVQAFGLLYRDGIQPDHVKESIAEFERSLSTPNSRFDRYLRNEPGAITRRELRGYQVFRSVGCGGCHQGVNVGGNMYQSMGVMVPYFTDGHKAGRADRGRFNITGDPADMYVFKVPGLRNVELTAPYFHDGSATTLTDAVAINARYQLGQTLTDSDVELIVAFLKTLTGELNGQPLSQAKP